MLSEFDCLREAQQEAEGWVRQIETAVPPGGDVMQGLKQAMLTFSSQLYQEMKPAKEAAKRSAAVEQLWAGVAAAGRAAGALPPVVASSKAASPSRKRRRGGQQQQRQQQQVVVSSASDGSSSATSSSGSEGSSGEDVDQPPAKRRWAGERHGLVEVGGCGTAASRACNHAQRTWVVGRVDSTCISKHTTACAHCVAAAQLVHCLPMFTPAG